MLFWNFADNSSKDCLANGSWSGPTDYYDCMCKVDHLQNALFFKLLVLSRNVDVFVHGGPSDYSS